MKKALKLKRKHPARKMNHGRHVIENIPYVFDLNEEEVKLLETKGPKHWITEVDIKSAKVKAKVKELTEREKLVKDAEEMGIKINKKDTIKIIEEKILKKINE